MTTSPTSRTSSTAISARVPLRLELRPQVEGTVPPPQRASRNEPLLIRLSSEVERARSAFRAGRAGRVSASSPSEQVMRAAHLASAMASYAAAAASMGVPLPYRYRDELRLYQAVTAAAVTSGELRRQADATARQRLEGEKRRDHDMRATAHRREMRAQEAAAAHDGARLSADQRHQEAASARDFGRRNVSRIERLSMLGPCDWALEASGA